MPLNLSTNFPWPIPCCSLPKRRDFRHKIMFTDDPQPLMIKLFKNLIEFSLITRSPLRQVLSHCCNGNGTTITLTLAISHNVLEQKVRVIVLTGLELLFQGLEFLLGFEDLLEECDE